MLLTNAATAGIEQSNDIMVKIAPAKPGEGIRITLRSPVMPQFGRAIESLIRQTLVEQGVTDVTVDATDQGALDYTVRARVLAALSRAGALATPTRGAP
jgi:citrate lyase subunit gamma (acyl carrier protein)